MKGTFRLALSSYVVLLSASRPALAMQESGIVPSRLVAVNTTAADRVSDTPAAVLGSRTGRPAAASFHLPRASAAAAETLAISLQGPSALRAPSNASYRARVGNGASGSRYYFWWFSAACARRVRCAPSSYTLVAEGLGRDSVDVPFSATSAEKDVVVQVAEVDGFARTGSSPMFVTLGPAQRPVSDTVAAHPTCDWFAGSFYPHTGDYKDPRTGRTWTRKFRRDYCGNRVQWDPEG